MGTTTLGVDTGKGNKGDGKGPLVGDLVKTRSWQVLGLVSVIALTFIYWRAFDFWWLEWWKKDSHYSHGILIPLMSAFLIWFNRKPIERLRAEPNSWGFALLLPAALLQFVANRAVIPSVAGLTFPIVLVGISLLLFGKRVTWNLLFPIMFLFFMCVPPSQILEKVSFQIQMLSTTVATAGLKLIGLQAHQSGTQIELENINVLVGAPCSGFRMLIALLAFTIFFAYMRKGPLWGRLSLIVLVLPLSLIANSIRVLMIALVGEYWGEDAMYGFHDYSGYIVLVIAFLILVQLAKVVKCREFKSMPV